MLSANTAPNPLNLILRQSSLYYRIREFAASNDCVEIIHIGAVQKLRRYREEQLFDEFVVNSIKTQIQSDRKSKSIICKALILSMTDWCT